MAFILALDQGTSSTRSIVFDEQGRIVSMAQQALEQIYPQPGWVEHDPQEIWFAQRDTARTALKQAGLGGRDIATIGITNQRETTVVWNRRTGQPVCNAIVWQDRRTQSICEQLQREGLQDDVRERTGLVIDPYFSATKLAWILRNFPEARDLMREKALAFGTIDSWLIWNLTGGQRHLTDTTNAARTMLFDIRSHDWDAAILEALGISRSVLPEVLPSCADFGQTDEAIFGAPIRISGVAGDQQSALFGQGCFAPGAVKNTYGTGCFMLMHTGSQFQASANGLLTTTAAEVGGQRSFAIEGSVFVAGAVVQWLRDGLGAISSSAQVQELAQSVPDADGVMFVPAFTGLGAPYWAPDARGTIVGLSRGSTIAHIARAALESIAFQSAALLEAMNRDACANGAVAVGQLRVDGGACVNDLLMQVQADLLGIPVVRPAIVETTALGAAYLAGLGAGIFSDLQEIEHRWQVDRVFEPTLAPDEVAQRMACWDRAVKQAMLTD